MELGIGTLSKSEQTTVYNDLSKLEPLAQILKDKADLPIKEFTLGFDDPKTKPSTEFVELHHTFDELSIKRPVRDYVYSLLKFISDKNPFVTINGVKNLVMSKKSDLRQSLSQDYLLGETFKVLFDLPNLKLTN